MKHSAHEGSLENPSLNDKKLEELKKLLLNKQAEEAKYNFAYSIKVQNIRHVLIFSQKLFKYNNRMALAILMLKEQSKEMELH